MRKLLCLLVAGVAGCDFVSPAQRPAHIGLAAEADTLNLARPTVRLAAELADAKGTPLTSGSVGWSASHPDVVITPVDGLQADVTWSPMPAGLAVAQVTATAGSVTASIPIVACPAQVIDQLHSALLLPGRAMRLAGEVHAGVSAELAVPIGWTSSDSSVLSISAAGIATAAGAGSAQITGSACGVSLSLTVVVADAAYTIHPISTGDGLGAAGLALNDSSQAVVGDAVLGFPSRFFLWKDGSAVEILDCLPRDLNNRGEVLCAGGGPTVWFNGAMQQLDTLSAAAWAINDDGAVAMVAGGSSVPRALRWRAGGTDTLHNVTVRSVRAMNNHGDVAGQIEFLYPPSYLWRGGAAQGLGKFGRWSEPRGMNAHGDVAGQSERPLIGTGAVAVLNRAAGGWGAEALRMSNRPDYPSRVASIALDVNDARQVVGMGVSGPFVWYDGRLGLLNDLVADTTWTITEVYRINNRGEILALGSRAGAVTAVLLRPTN